jgi:aldehyde dehydrogenase (NAD+)
VTNQCTKFYIGGQWVEPHGQRVQDVVNPANERVIGCVRMGDAADVDRAVAAAKGAFASYANSTRAERIALLESVLAVYQRRYGEMAQAISSEMGAPKWLAEQAQAAMGQGHIAATLETLRTFAFEERRGTTLLRREPVGVCALITPWNWPINQVACKVLPALAAGCTMVLKPSELAPLSATLFAEILHEAGVPPGVFNLIHGDGVTVGSALSSHPDVDMVSFTGSTRAGVEVAKNAAPTVKRVAQELGGKSPNVLLDDADFATAVPIGIQYSMANSGQSCNSPTRMLVPASRHDEAVAIATATLAAMKVGDPAAADTIIGPVVSRTQYDRIQRLIQQGIDEGATLACGGTGRPPGLETGYYVRPTIFSNVRNDMTIAREEIFGPVLCIIPYATDDDAIRIANDTPYGLSSYVSGRDPARVQRVVESLRAGMVHVNGASVDLQAPFGGYKQSGNGREWGEFGLHDFLEVKAVMNPAS